MKMVPTCVQLNAVSTDATDLDICVSGGRVLANVGNFVLSDVAACVQNCNKEKESVNQRIYLVCWW